MNPAQRLAEMLRTAADLETVNPASITPKDRDTAFLVEMSLMRLRNASVAEELGANTRRIRRLIGQDVAAIVAKSDTDEALDGAIDRMLDSGDLDVDDEPVVKLGQGTSEVNWPPRDGGGQ